MIHRSILSLFLLISLLASPLFSEEKRTIDVIYTWVDGADEGWQKTRSEWMKKMNPDAPTTHDAQASRRFRDREELKFSLRALHKYAPFVRHIYIVTCGQRPKWLKNHSKISIIHHTDIFKDGSHLPTFNSMAIESNLHHIKGLSEQYLYFNDDVFLTKPASVNDFFTREGKVRLFLSKHHFE